MSSILIIHEEERNALVKQRDYLINRLSELSLDLSRLLAKASARRALLERAPAGSGASEIRRRRSCIGRRRHYLKRKRRSLGAALALIKQKLQVF